MSFGLGAGLALNNTELVFTDALYDRAVVNLQDSVVDSRITFTRASDRSYFDSNGVLQYATTDEWPLEYDPETGLVLGRSVWAAATNLCLRSEELDAASWVTTRVSVSADAIAAPDGATTADKLVEDSTAAASHLISQGSIAVTTGVTYTFSMFAKAAERSWVRIGLLTRFAASSDANFDLSAGTVGTVGAGASSASITDVGGGWYRIRVTATANATGNCSIDVRLATADNVTAYNGDGASGVYIWGAQLETGSIATPYIPTTTATVTRAADSAVISTLSSIGFNASEGTIVVDATVPVAGTRYVTSLDDGTGNERIGLYLNTTAMADVVVDGGAVQSNLTSGGAVAQGQRIKAASAYKLNDFAFSAIGAAAATDASGTVPTMTRLQIGASVGGAAPWNGYIRSLTYVPRRLANADLVSLSKV